MNAPAAGEARFEKPWPSGSPGQAPSFYPRPYAAASIATQRLWFYIGLLTSALLLGALWNRVVRTIPAGHHAVMYYRLDGGTSTARAWDEGLYLIAPWNKLTAYETRLQTRTVSLKVPSEEGMEMSVSVALRFRPYVESLGYLHKDVGPDYFERLILPEVHGHLRKILGKRKAQEIYTGANGVLEEIARVPVLSRLRVELGQGGRPDNLQQDPPYVLLEELRVLDIVRPTLVADAVNEKQRQEQLSLEYKHRLQREEQEAERKRVEAAGIHDYSRIAGTLSPDVLRWRNLETTLELARSNNAKVVVLGNSQGALPMMLNLGDSTTGPEHISETPRPNRSEPAREREPLVRATESLRRGNRPPASPPASPPPTIAMSQESVFDAAMRPP